MFGLALPVIGLVLFALVLILLANLRSTTIRIADIISDPNRYEGQEVAIAGEVTEASNWALRCVFRVADGTGNILVLYQNTCPDVGRRVRVRGVVKTLFRVSWLGIRATVIEANSVE